MSDLPTMTGVAPSAENVIDLTAKRRNCLPEKGYDTAKGNVALGRERNVCHVLPYESAIGPVTMTVETPGESVPFHTNDEPRNQAGPESLRRRADRLDGVSLAEFKTFTGVDIVSTFGSRFKEARKDSRVQLEVIAQVVGFKRQSLPRWETLRDMPRTLSETKFAALVKLLGVRDEWLRHGRGPMRDAGTTPAPRPVTPATAPVTELGSLPEDGNLRRAMRALQREAKAKAREFEDLVDRWADLLDM